MKISAKEWILFILVAILCLGLWYKFEYPNFSFVDLSVDKEEALARAESYLQSLRINTQPYSKAIVFNTDDWPDRYLQKTLGIRAEEEFIKKHDYELFFWQVRFFKEFQKEEFSVIISPKSGEILSFDHLIDDAQPRDVLEKDFARGKAEGFLKNAYRFNLNDYEFHEEKIKRYDSRIDYSFSWEKKGVRIPWRQDQGIAKLLTGATVSGLEVRRFYKGVLDIPEKFGRYIENQLILGQYISSFAFLLFMFLLACSVFVMAKRKDNIAFRLSKKWFLYLGLFIILANTANIVNNLQAILIDYPTSSNKASFLGISSIKLIITIIFFSLSFILPGFAGESLHSEVFPQNRQGSFLHYIRSTFFSRGIAKSITLGYLLFFIMLGLQAVIFYFGQRYLGVWKEWVRLTQLSSSYLPFLSAFAIAVTASFSEEIIYRLFAISWIKKYFKNTILAVIVSALIWGFGHSAYAIFPVWFRGIEVSLIGLLFGFMFIKYGLIPLIIAHYLFDVFWGVSAYILGHSPKYLFTGSIFTLAIPLIFATIAYFMNREEKEKEIKIVLNTTEEYNLNILITFITAKKSQGLSPEAIKVELLYHNWDITLIELAIKDVFKA